MYGLNVSTFCSWHDNAIHLYFGLFCLCVCALCSDLTTEKIVWCNKCRLDFNSCIVLDGNDGTICFSSVCEYWFLFGFIAVQCICDLWLAICIYVECFRCVAAIVVVVVVLTVVVIVIWKCVDVDTETRWCHWCWWRWYDDTMIRWWWCNGSWPAVDLSNALHCTIYL